MSVPNDSAADTTAKLMLIALAFAWGLTWPAMRLALTDIPPFSMRTISTALGAGALLLTVKLQGRSLWLHRKDWIHIVVGSILNIVCFTMLSAFALLMASTSRVTILSYTMPIWSSLFAYIALGERFDRTRSIALALCVAGMAVLIAPLWQNAVPVGVLLAAATGMTWGAGTVYIKWARIDGDPATVAAWQLTVAFFLVTACLPFVEGGLQLSQAHLRSILGMIFTGLVGSGLAYFLWFKIIGRLPAMTASLGVLSVPVVGIVATVIFLGERPTVPDIVGFVLIFAASACAMLPSRTATAPEPA